MLRKDLAYAKDKQFHIGLKLVRGAYMDQVSIRLFSISSSV